MDVQRRGVMGGAEGGDRGGDGLFVVGSQLCDSAIYRYHCYEHPWGEDEKEALADAGLQSCSSKWWWQLNAGNYFLW